MTSTATAPRRDLLQIRGLSAGEIVTLLDAATKWLDPASVSDRLAGRTVINLFLEPSTRTRVSFEIAAKRLGASVVNIAAASSSLVKGETLVDTARTLDAMHPDAIVIRHPSSGAPQIVARHTRAVVINGGDGAHEHPTQALLDALTMRIRKGRIDRLRVAIVGDVRHSRVARSNAHLLTTVGSDVVLCGPRSLLPEGIESIVGEAPGKLHATSSIDEALEGADVVMMLRVQHERQQESFFPSIGEYRTRYGLDAERLRRAKPDAIVMHPGPVNRGVEVSPDVADGPQSVILEQVANGVAVRMAVLDGLVGTRKTTD
ncbi:MAG: aspartate carbamoyltransferase catalytic subunit [Blastocatellia bacterium]|nr:aspartate carbamoyltransferase catalytic subunit [Blastocatellia bacterium]